ncbi:DNA-3-methyladenine glycosylase [Xylanimonas cellulosilytica DSM 15894]|uniref:Putative 3-methyladenine DNA glycosylase n=1 Tax=Xylanimonas cellulosilytica (strain DSM 15894 / JCM 12276 / CECT 5975 / KCTC 9989 / LMG 20990 / NBRC 107835 / XIL07) TaxID=446471 RepID=D1BRB1_XYLCX|nr:DNA-3-methyladenine glycosylase [Xylanimonas cellulosilytica]ACZ30366.1 DNA-3-methyladenine glycosylase [Xylanimonas cellulosilytica DSM 15894]
MSTPSSPAPAETQPSTVPGHAWYARDVHDVARDLLGAVLVRRTPEGTVALRITEVEAYDGEDDPGSHAFRGRTPRNATMFGEPGRVYVYRHLGLHHCVNVVCGPVGRAAAVLLRAGEVVEGAALARSRRLAVGACDSDRQLARGPARLTVALALSLSDDGADLTDREGDLTLTLPVDRERGAVATGPRVGVSGEAGRGDLYPWRSWLVGEPTVSAYRPVSPRRRPA